MNKAKTQIKQATVTDNDVTDVIIVGAGVPGCLLALKCAQAGLTVTVIEYDAAPKDTQQTSVETGRSVALMQAACDDLKELGIWDSVAPYVNALQALKIIDDSYYPAADEGAQTLIRQTYYADEIGVSVFGYNIPLALLVEQARKALIAHKNINALFDVTIKDIQISSQYAQVSVENCDLIYQAPLIIGADGRESIVRQKAGFAVVKNDYDTVAMTAILSHENDHESISTEFHRPSGPFTLVPMQGRKSSLVWCEKTKDAHGFLNANKQTQQDAIQDRSRGLLGQITLESNVHGWPLIAQQAQTLALPRVTLIAEAAHVLSPIGAQGMNLSLRDVDDLYHVIREAAMNGLDIGSVSILDRYVKARKVDLWSRGKGIDMFHRSVATSSPLMHKARRGVLQTVSMIQPIRDILMKEGLAPKRRA